MAAILAGMAGLTGVAHAGTIATAPLQKADADYFVCRVMNSGSTPRDVVIEIHSGTGEAANGPFSYTIPAGQSVSQLYTGSFHDVASCVVTGQTSKNKTQVAFCIRPNGVERCEATATAP
jgi:hypothetical protein